jgi:hypothetical protein
MAHTDNLTKAMVIAPFAGIAAAFLGFFKTNKVKNTPKG